MKGVVCEEISLDKIRRGPNIRKTVSKEANKRLTQSIITNGVIQPIVLVKTGEDIELLAGERRLNAAVDAKLDSIPAVIRTAEVSEGYRKAIQFIENIHREELPPMDAAIAIKEIMQDLGLSAAGVAELISESEGNISKRLSLLDAAQQVREMVADGRLAPATAVEIARLDNAEGQVRIAHEVIKRGFTRDDTVGMVKAEKRQRDNSTGNCPARVTAILPTGCSVTVAGPKLCLDTFIEGLELLLKQARRARPKGIDLRDFIKALRDQAKQASTEESAEVKTC